MKRIFSVINKEHIYMGLVLLIFAYLAIQVFIGWFQTPVRQDYIKDGHAVDFETESALSDKALADAAKSEILEQNSQAISTLYYCLSTAEVAGNYDCISNIVSDDVKANFSNNENEDAGENIYQAILQDRVLTGVNKDVIQERQEKSHYNVWFSFLNGAKESYVMHVENGKIVKLEGRN